MGPRDRPLRLAYSNVPPRQPLLPLGGIDGRAASPACPPVSLQKRAVQPKSAGAEASRPPRPQTTEPRQAPESSRRPQIRVDPPRPQSVAAPGRFHDTSPEPQPDTAMVTFFWADSRDLTV